MLIQVAFWEQSLLLTGGFILKFKILFFIGPLAFLGWCITRFFLTHHFKYYKMTKYITAA